MATTQPVPDVGWAKVELMGHRVAYGYVREHSLAGKLFVRIDVPRHDHPPAGDPAGPFSHAAMYSPDSVFAFHPIAADVCVALAKGHPAPPVDRYELPREHPPLPALPAAPVFQAAGDDPSPDPDRHPRFFPDDDEAADFRGDNAADERF